MLAAIDTPEQAADLLAVQIRTLLSQAEEFYGSRFWSEYDIEGLIRARVFGAHLEALRESERHLHSATLRTARTISRCSRPIAATDEEHATEPMHELPEPDR